MNSAGYYTEREAEDAMAVIAGWIGRNRNINVIYHDSTAVDADIFKGRIRIPRMACASGITEEALMLLRGRIYHEAGHIDETRISEAEYPKKAAGKAKFDIWNALEDRRMEAVESRKHKGCEYVFRWSTEYYNRKIAEKMSAGSKSRPLWEALVAMSFMVEGMRPLWTVSQKAQHYIDKAYGQFSKVKGCKDARASLRLAEKIYDLLKDASKEWKENEASEEKESGQKGEKGHDGEQEQGDEGKALDGEGEEGEGEGKEDGNQSSMQQGDIEDEDDGDSSRDEGKSGSDGDESGDEDEGNGSGSGDEEGDEDSGSKSEGGESESDEDGSDEGAEGDKAGDKSEGEGGDKGDKRPGDGKGEDNPERSSESDEEAEKELDEESEGQSQEDIQNEEIAKCFKEMDPKDLKYISRRDKDEHHFPVTTDVDKVTFKDRRDRVSAMVVSMTRALEQALRALARCRRKPYMRQGKIDKKRLVQIARGLSKEVFFKTKNGIDMDVAVAITIDESGSMNSWEEVQMLAMAIGEALHSIGVPFEITGSTTRNEYPYAPALEGFSRTNPIVYQHYKEFNESWPTVRQRIVHTGAHHHNIDGEVVEYAAFRLMQRKESRKVVFSLSDGQPIGGHGSANDALLGSNLKRVCDRVREAGIEVYGCGIKTKAPMQFYGAEYFLFLNSVEDMAVDFTKKLVEVVTKGFVRL